jgi:hypothetical protein
MILRIDFRGPAVASALTLVACGTAKNDGAADDDGIDVPTSGPGAESSGAAEAGDDDAADDAGEMTGESSPGGGSTTEADAPPPVVWDVGYPDAPYFDCGAPTHISCDGNGELDPYRTMGLNCPTGPQVDGVYNGDPQSLYIHEGDLGTHVPAPFPPREGDAMVIMSSGIASQMPMAAMYASTDIDGYVDGGTDLPPPLNTQAVSLLDTCTDDPGLVGTGDCSNTIQAQWEQGNGAHDYNELRFTTEVPPGTFGFSYDLAMFSTEYPVYYQSQFNDMYIAWLESELWTGNISFDEMGHPISLNAGFLDYKDAPNDFDCPAPCDAPELDGTAMMDHAGTKWLTTTAGVTPGEDIEVVFAVFDLSDGILDTVVLLDNFQWACEGGPPTTIPG